MGIKMSDNKSFKKIGILGGGKMGGGFFDCISGHAGFDIVLYARNTEKREILRQAYLKKLARKQKSPGAGCHNCGEVVFTGNLDDLGDTDIVFEFTCEDKRVKKELIKKLVLAKKKKEQVIVTGSSSMVPGRLWENCVEDNVFGVHFMYPVQYMKTVELVYKRGSHEGTIAKVRDFLIGIGKRPVLMPEEVGAFTIRIMSAIAAEAFNFSKETGVSPGEVDRIVMEEGFADPPFNLCDSVGLETIRNSLEELYAGTEEYCLHIPLLEYIEDRIAEGKLGKKTGAGILDYGKKENGQEAAAATEHETRELAADRLRMIYIKTCFGLLDGCWMESSTLDEVMGEVYGTVHGPVTMAYEYGLERVVEKLDNYAQQYGKQYTAPGILKYAAANKAGREELDRQIGVFAMAGTRPDWHTGDIRQAVQ
jgi:3-hydroxybutyryl-CoA dehydrogenase